MMQILLKSLIGAAALFAATLTAGYIKARNHKPDLEAAWANGENLPKRVTFRQ